MLSKFERFCLLFRRKINEEPAFMYLNSAFDSAQGEIKILREWNKSLESQNQELKEIIYHRFGLHVKLSESNENISPDKAIPLMETWRTAKGKLEKSHSRPQESVKTQEYWEEKLRKQEEEEKSLVNKDNVDAKVS